MYIHRYFYDQKREKIDLKINETNHERVYASTKKEKKNVDLVFFQVLNFNNHNDKKCQQPCFTSIRLSLSFLFFSIRSKCIQWVRISAVACAHMCWSIQGYLSLKSISIKMILSFFFDDKKKQNMSFIQKNYKHNKNMCNSYCFIDVTDLALLGKYLLFWTKKEANNFFVSFQWAWIENKTPVVSMI